MSMIHIEKIENSNALLTHLHIHSETLSAKIYPNLGGSIQELEVSNVRIIDGISDDAQGLADYAVSYKSSVLFPFPNRIEDGIYEFDGNSYQFPINETPFHNALHGLVYNKAFVVKETSSDEKCAVITLTYNADGIAPGFPFPFSLTLTYKIDQFGNLRLDFDVLNTGNSSFPYGMGWHPYLLSKQLSDSQLSFPSIDHFECNERMLPVKNSPSQLPASFKMENRTFDDAYSLAAATCSLKTESYTLTFAFDDAADTYLQVYTPPHGKSIAIEPMTCVANSFNSGLGLKELLPQAADSWTIQMDVQLKS